MKRILLASAAAMVMAGSAYAAEPILEPLPPAPPVVEPFIVPTWAGPYVGADIGWGWIDDDEDNFLVIDNNAGDIWGISNSFGFNHDDDDDETDGVVGGIFAGWLGQSGSFLYGVEIYGQLADIGDDDDDDDDNGGRFRVGTSIPSTLNGFDQCVTFTTVGGPNRVACADTNRGLDGLAGLEGIIGWGGERAAFLLHAGPAIGFFNGEGSAFFDADGDGTIDAGELVAFSTSDDDDDTEFGISVAAEGRFKLSERVFAGVIGRAVWFGGGDDDDHNNDNAALQTALNSAFAPGAFSVSGGHGDDDDDNVLFEVKARIGLMFGQPAVAAPVEVAY